MGTTTSTTYTSTLTGGTGASNSVTVTGTHTVLVTLTATMRNSNDTRACYVSFSTSPAADSGAQAASDSFGVAAVSQGNNNVAASAPYLVTVATGTTAFTAEYKATSNTCTFVTSRIILQVY